MLTLHLLAMREIKSPGKNREAELELLKSCGSSGVLNPVGVRKVTETMTELLDLILSRLEYPWGSFH